MTAPVVGAPPRPALVRPRDGRLVAGVAMGTATHLGLDPLVVRAVFFLLGVAGVGVVGYALLWLTMPVADSGTGPQQEGAAPVPGPFTGVLSGSRPPNRRQLAALVLLGICALALVGQLISWMRTDLALSLAIVAVGLAVIWRQLDVDRTLARPGVRWSLAGGAVLAGGGVALLLATTGQLANARNGFAATLVILVGVALATAPLWRRLLDTRSAERAARVRSEERAAVAAHLHDSVLQTLALIQRHADEPQAVGRLARGQERELRSWLYEPAVCSSGTWAGLVARVVADVEADHALTVDPVVVGDAPVDDDLVALGAATRESLVNVAKHAGVETADLYTEVGPERISVYIRDRGAGFDPEEVPADRRGLRDSVAGRLARLGGTAVVRSAFGEGTEVELCLPRRTA